MRELDESDQCLASSCTIKDMIEQSSGSGSGLPLLVCIAFIMLSVFMCVTAVIGVVTL